MTRKHRVHRDPRGHDLSHWLASVRRNLGAVSIFVVLSLFKERNGKMSHKPKALIHCAKNNCRCNTDWAQTPWGKGIVIKFRSKGCWFPSAPFFFFFLDQSLGSESNIFHKPQRTNFTIKVTTDESAYQTDNPKNSVQSFVKYKVGFILCTEQTLYHNSQRWIQGRIRLRTMMKAKDCLRLASHKHDWNKYMWSCAFSNAFGKSRCV